MSNENFTSSQSTWIQRLNLIVFWLFLKTFWYAIWLPKYKLCRTISSSTYYMQMSNAQLCSFKIQTCQLRHSAFFSFAQWRYHTKWCPADRWLLLVENYSQYPAQTTLIGRLVQFFMAPKGAATLNNNSIKITIRANKQTTGNEYTTNVDLPVQLAVTS